MSDEPATGPRGLPEDWTAWKDEVDLDRYDARWAAMAQAGENPHGEADLVHSLGPGSVLDGGCGTGRVGIELARRASELDPDIKIMFITGFAAVALNSDSEAPKNAKVLSKPVHLRELVSEVNKMLAA